MVIENNNLDEQINEIQAYLTDASRYEQLAEECSELAQAALKKARKIRNENYTPKTMDEIDESLKEEFTDVLVAARVCNLKLDISLAINKCKRWINRLLDIA